MTAIFEQFAYYWDFPFVRYAFIVGILIALCSSLLGVTLVLKRLSFIGDGLSHVAFGAMSIAIVVQMTNQMLIILPITIIAAILLLNPGKKAKIKGDAAIAMLSVSALAGGYFLINIFSVSANVTGDVCSTLFGSTSILTLTKAEVFVCICMSILVILFYLCCYHRIFSITFDENFATATGLNVRMYNLAFAVITAIIIVLAMNLVGSLLISALIIFPSLSAMRVMKSYRNVIWYSAILSVVGAFLGLLLAILLSTPVGSTIVMFDLFIFLLHFLIAKIVRG